jgi:hypothetical protein
MGQNQLPPASVIKLKTGETLIAVIYDLEKPKRRKKVEPELLAVGSPLQIHQEYDPHKRSHNMYFSKWIPCTDDKLMVIPKDSIMTICIPIPEIEEFYHQTIQELSLVDLADTNNVSGVQLEPDAKTKKNIARALEDKDLLQ